MTFFEQELKRIVDAGCGINTPTYAARACYGNLGSDLVAKMQFEYPKTVGKYSTVSVAIMNRKEGVVDKANFRMRDVWGVKHVVNSNFPKGISPYIWDTGDDIDWYVYQPTSDDIIKLAESIRGYIEVFDRKESE